jgi:hypothetical protein
MQSRIGVIEGILSIPVSPELVVRSGNLPMNRVQELRHGYEAFSKDYRLSPKKRSQFRPYLHPKLLNLTERGTVLDYTAFFADFDLNQTPSLQEDLLKAYLLYCDGVILHDPLLYILDYAESSEYLKQTQQRLQRYFAFLSYVRPLVEIGTLAFIDEAQYRKSYSNWPVQLTDDLAGLIESVGKTYSGTIDKETLEFVLWYGLDGVSSSLVANDFHSSNLDMFFPHRGLAEAFPFLVPPYGTKKPIIERHQARLLSSLISLKLPRLDALTVADTVSIRKSEEVFSKWRLVLERGLERIELLGFDAKGNEVKIIRQELEDVAHHIEERVQSSTFLSRAQKGLRDFSIASLASIALEHFFDPARGIATAAGKEVLGLLWSSYFGNSRSEGEKAFVRHAVVFDEMGDGY